MHAIMDMRQQIYSSTYQHYMEMGDQLYTPVSLKVSNTEYYIYLKSAGADSKP